MAARRRWAVAVCLAGLRLGFGAPLQAEDVADQWVRAARSQVGVTRIYDGSYRRLAYPGGDVPLERGVCTDVIVQAYRAVGVDIRYVRTGHYRYLPAASP